MVVGSAKPYTTEMKTLSEIAFYQVDVFSASPTEPFTGNPVAVLFDTQGMSADRMQQIARWTNLSETTFVSNMSAKGYSVRIFTPGGELPFAGHPSLGTAFAVARCQGLSGTDIPLLQRCGVGDVAIVVNTHTASVRLELPKAQLTPISQQATSELSAALGCELGGKLGCELSDDPMIVDLGPRWLTVPVSSGDVLLAIKPNLEAIAALSRKLNITGVNVFGEYASSEDNPKRFEVRSFAPAFGVPEDPVCGSGNGAVAYYLRDHVKTSFTEHRARQGRAIQRDGHIAITYKGDAIWLGGFCINSVIGKIDV
jgi:PhzF family phenazine biosynthesis protein